MSNNGYRTPKGYESEESGEITAAMEDYLEMILRLGADGERDTVRIGELAEHLAVRPSSASKMVSRLKEQGLVLFEKYGLVFPTDKGKKYGEYLLLRHTVLNRLLCMINETENELRQVERTEHFFDERTVRNIEAFLGKSGVKTDQC